MSTYARPQKSRSLRPALSVLCLAFALALGCESDARLREYTRRDALAQDLANVCAALCDEDAGIPYRPNVANVSRRLWGIAVTTVDGVTVTAGDAFTEIPLQSAIKPFNLAAALKTIPREQLIDVVGVNATGYPYSAMEAISSRIDAKQNPMVSAGALSLVSMIPSTAQHPRNDYLRHAASMFAGSRLSVHRRVYEYECSNDTQTAALAAAQRERGALFDDVKTTVKDYLYTTSLAASAVDMSVMAATLANYGINPVTSKKACSRDTVVDVLSVMVISGLYDESGEWFLEVGLPAKSGVGGAILAVAPGRLGIAAVSPNLNSHGTSVRGKRALEQLSRKWKLHLLE